MFFFHFSQARRRGIAQHETYSHFHLQLGKIHTLFRHRYIVVFSFFLREKFEPSAGRRFDKLRYAERQRTHEIVPRRPIPIPNFDQKSSVFVLRFQIAKNRIGRSLATFLLLFACNKHIFFASRLKTTSLEIVSRGNEFYRHLQNDRLVPLGIQRGFDRFRFLLHVVRIRNQLQLDVGIRQTVWIHRNQISSLFHCNRSQSLR